ncbi:uncharacterized protein wu:fl23c11 isoform X2 [Cololabis saira]|uniref:uncharacterized protein wu:fl23c11 isoform X2 n=1 Tax=Cololabis saira TaxID=129043 RepID=UPI002AD2CD16|nr:uncharacterized protein wu:fl23c11 isoform X2 [Cololabis saira]
MALHHRGPPWGPHVSLLLSLLPLWMGPPADALELIFPDTPELICCKGCIDCHVSPEAQFTAALADPHGSVDITQLQLITSLCRSETQDYKPCLRIDITLQEVDIVKGVSEESGDDSEEKVLVQVCISSAGFLGVCKAIQFKPGTQSQSSGPSTHKLVLIEKVNFGITIVVTAHSKETYVIQNVTSPTLDEVCSMKLGMNITQCAVPRLQAVIEQERNVVRLQLENADFKHEELFLQMDWNEIPGKVLTWPKGESEMVISSNFVAPCLCFQIWSKGKSRRGKYCPFKDQQDALERMLHNVSLSVVKSRVRDGRTGLSWNVTSPCRLEAEVWLCKKDLSGGRCEEVMGSRQKLKPGWSATRNAHLQTGEFDVPHQPHLCVQMTLEGTRLFLEPHCPFTASRARWILPLLMGLLLMCLAILGVYITQGVLKGYVWRWLKEDDVKGAVGGGHVVLLYSPDDDNQELPELLCHLGSCLQALGFTVSLDLWSQAELSILGPVPWLHSRLDRLQRQGGKVVLVLTQATWTRAEEWGAFVCGRNTPRERHTGVGEETLGVSHPAPSRRVDVFGASLNCVLADCIQGRAGERFMLVQLESLPPEPPGSFRPLPQLFRGLHVYSLPSQSLGFLTELAGARHIASASARRKRAGGLRMASRTLARRLSGFTAGTNVARLADVTQSCIGVGVELSVETIPLNPYLLTPPSTPDADTKTSEIGCI